MTHVKLLALTRRFIVMDTPARLLGYFAVCVNNAFMKRLGLPQG